MLHSSYLPCPSPSLLIHMSDYLSSQVNQCCNTSRCCLPLMSLSANTHCASYPLPTLHSNTLHFPVQYPLSVSVPGLFLSNCHRHQAKDLNNHHVLCLHSAQVYSSDTLSYSLQVSLCHSKMSSASLTVRL